MRAMLRSLPAAFCVLLVAAAVPALSQVPEPPPQRSGDQATAFLANPALLLKDNPDGGARMLAQVRDLAIADPATLQSLLSLTSSASKDQKAAIGAGLAQAARAVLRTNPTYANQIQLAIVNLKDQEIMVAYTAASGQQAIGATGGAGGALVGGGR